jgi:signal transduction histidine kinase
MKERAGYIGGRVEVQSEPGRGTRVRAEIPLREEDAAAD